MGKLLAENINPSGLIPLDFQCLVKIDKAEEVSLGGIVIAKKQVEKEQWAETRGTLIRAGSCAFSGWEPQDFGDGEPRLPRPGDRIMIRQYNAYRVKGNDGEFYNLVADKDILLVIIGEDTSKTV